jgi:trk system potassium uptake protein TrkH
VFLGRRPIPDSLVERIAGFMVIYAMLVVGGTFVLAALGTDLLTAASGVISSLGNMGPALQNAGPTASFVDGYSAPARLVLAFMMLVGRLEIFPMVLMMVAPYRTLRHRLPRL